MTSNLHTPHTVLVVDAGGTSLRAGLYRPGRGLVSVKRTNTPNLRVLQNSTGVNIFRYLLDKIFYLSSLVLENSLPQVVVLSFAGPVDIFGRALAAPTIWGNRVTDPINLKNLLEKKWPSAKIYVINDVTAAGYRYRNHPKEDFCIVTVSSGIGSKVFLNGRPILGSNGMGGEIGHIRIDLAQDAPVCDCGGIGHLGAVASGRASVYQARRLYAVDPKAFASSALGHKLGGKINQINNNLIAEFNRVGDSWTRTLVQRMAQPLGYVLATLRLSLGISRFVIIGGFALALGEPYRCDLVNAASECSWYLSGDWNAMIELGIEDDDSCLIGAGIFGATSPEREFSY